MPKFDKKAPKAKQTKLAPEKAKLEAECNDAEIQLVYRSEAHLFAVDVGVCRNEILKLIKSAREFAQKNEIPAARKALVSAYCKMDDAVATRGRTWSWMYIHAVPVWAYHITIVTGVVVACGYFGLFDMPEHSNPNWRVVVTMGSYGVLGGEVRGLYWLFQKVQTRSFRAQMFIPHIGAPWLAFVLGVLSFVLMKAGVSVFATSGTSSASSTFAYMTTAALAGFS